MPNNLLRKAIIAAIITTLIGCSAGGGETGTGLDDKTTVGVITSFGSVYVNGVKYETDNASISIDGTSESENALSIGMLVSLKGNVNPDGVTGNASVISFEKNVEGIVVENKVLTTNRLDVMGQIVIVNNDTIFESKESTITEIEKILPDHVVQVSGYSSGDGIIYATRVSLEKLSHSAGEEFKVQGIATNVSTDLFQIGKRIFSYSETVLKNFDNKTFENGDFVSVKTKGEELNGNFIVTEVKYKNSGSSSIDNLGDSEVEIEGYINKNLDLVLNTFSVNGQQVKIDALTKIESGSKDLLLKGMKVKVQGIANAQNIIIASEVEIKQESNRQFKGHITAVNSSGKTITVAGQEILITNTTRLKDERDDVDEISKRYFKFEDLVKNDFVEISAYKNSNDRFVATRLERDEQDFDDESSAWELEGKVTSLNPLTIDGQVVEYLDSEFNGAVGDKVELEGVINEDGIWQVTDSSSKEEWDEEVVISSIDLDNEIVVTEGGDEVNVSKIIFNAFVGNVVEMQGIIVDGIRYVTEMEIKQEDEEKDEKGSSEQENETLKEDSEKKDTNDKSEDEEGDEDESETSDDELDD